MSIPTSVQPTSTVRRAASPNRRVRALAVAALAAVVLGACGSESGPVPAAEPATGDETGPVAAPSSDASTSASESATAAESGDKPSSELSGPTVVATVPTSLPEDLVGQVGVVEVIGEPLPKLGKVAIEADPARGTMAPVLIGSTFDGEEVRIDAAESGRPTLVFFFAHWCPHCNNEIPVLNDLRDSNAFRPDLDIYAISTAVNPSAPNFPPSKWIKDMDWTYPTIVDGIADDQKTFLGNESFGSSGFPFAVLINADGTVAARWSGEAPGGGETIISNIETYLAY